MGGRKLKGSAVSLKTRGTKAYVWLADFNPRGHVRTKSIRFRGTRTETLRKCEERRQRKKLLQASTGRLASTTRLPYG